MMIRILTLCNSLSRVAAWVSGGMLFAISALIAIEVILRKVFAVSLGGADELSGYTLAISCSWAFAYALFRKAHIRIDVLYVKFSKLLQTILDIGALLLFAIFITVVSYYAFEVFLISWDKGSTANTPLHTPLWIPQLLWALGLIGCSLATIIMLITTCCHLLSGDLVGLRQLLNPTTLLEEIEESCGEIDNNDTEIIGGRA